jgi:hypothetical protein
MSHSCIKFKIVSLRHHILKSSLNLFLGRQNYKKRAEFSDRRGQGFPMSRVPEGAALQRRAVEWILRGTMSKEPPCGALHSIR